jgi:hypothetical protein
MNMQSSQAHIHHLAQQVNPLHQASREDRIKLAAWEDEQPFSILGELELLASQLQGYVGQLTADRLEQPAATIIDLQNRNPFAIAELANWYFANGADYPHLCRYLELLDYLRLSLLSTVQTSYLQAA